MKKYAIPEDQAYKGLDGALIELADIDRSKLPNQNRFFLGAPFSVLGLILLLFGIIRYGSQDEEFYILLAIGLILFVGGSTVVLKAAIYLLTWKTFLNNANFTKCNVFIFTKSQECRDEPMRAESSIYYYAYYTLKVCFIDLQGNRCEKIIRSVQALDLYKKKLAYLIWEDNKYSLYDECVAAYNTRGKMRLIY